MSTYQDRLNALRDQLAREPGSTASSCRLTDEHMSEYVGAYAQRLAWLTGFGGSAGSAVVLAERRRSSSTGAIRCRCANRWTARSTQYESVPRPAIADWLKATCSGEGARIGYDPWLHTQGLGGCRQARRWRTRARRWCRWTATRSTRSGPTAPPPASPGAGRMTIAMPGKPSEEKRAGDGRMAGRPAADAAVLSALDGIAWLLNIRGKDVERTPVALSFAIAHADGTADLFIAPEKVTKPCARIWAMPCGAPARSFVPR
jgi:Xaa-Pro aminopeptidase